MKSSSDTIVAIATAPGEAGIAIVRISGQRSLDIADEAFRGKPPKPSGRPANSFVRGFICSASEDGTEGDIDEVILLIYRAPRSYTREDVVEIQGHGGRACAKRILRTVLDAGARLAEPGEFTKRAFLNGRIDLLQAEAVADLIRARSDRAASAALEQLEGSLSSVFAGTYDSLLDIAGDLEATLDFPEAELPVSTISEMGKRIDGVISNVEHVLRTWEEGHLLREGALVVISGRPNAGKSTLLNCLLGTERAIVTDVPGTTRDTVEEQVILDGIVIRLVDTAGLRDTESTVEREGVQRAHASMDRADINLHVVDCSRPLDGEDRKRLEMLDPGKCVVVLNKTDVGRRVAVRDLDGFSTVWCSLLRGAGIAAVREAIVSKLGVQSSGPAHAVISERHRGILQNVLNALNEAKGLLQGENEELVVLAAGVLRVGLQELGTLTGRVYDESLLDNIFSRFCIGK